MWALKVLQEIIEHNYIFSAFGYFFLPDLNVLLVLAVYRP